MNQSLLTKQLQTRRQKETKYEVTKQDRILEPLLLSLLPHPPRHQWSPPAGALSWGQGAKDYIASAKTLIATLLQLLKH